jgi:hypothetical protein
MRVQTYQQLERGAKPGCRRVTATVVFLLLTVAQLGGCQKSILIEPQPHNQKVSIEGLLQPGEVPKIYVNHTVPFFESIETQTPSSLFVPDARVTISTDGTADFLTADSTFSMFFCRWEPYYIGTTPILDNATYALSVEHDGRTYTASTTTNVSKVTIDSVSYTSAFVDIFGGHEGVIVDFTDIPGEENQYRFYTTRPLTTEHQTTDDREYSSTCLAEGDSVEITEIGRVVYFDDNLDGSQVRFVAEPFYTQFQGDESVVYIQSVDEQVAYFYDTLNRQHEANINPFAEPVTLYTMIEGAIGVFGAVRLSDPVPFVFPEDHLN